MCSLILVSASLDFLGGCLCKTDPWHIEIVVTFGFCTDVLERKVSVYI